MNEKIEKAIKPILKMYTDIETELLLIIANHFKYDEEFYNSDYWRIQKLEEMGLFNQEVIKFISKYANKPISEVKKALNDISIDTINQGELKELFKEGKININPKILKNNYTIQNIINYAYNDLSNRLIQMSNKIETSARKAYLDVVESAYLKTSMGTHSYQEAIRSAIDDLSNRGLTILTYKTTDENGNIVGIRNYDIEGAVRRETLTAARQLSGNISIEVANQLECEYVYLSEHLRCRPSHFDWQGTIIKREDLIKVTHYGEVDGLYGINCAHYVEPYFGDARGNELKKISKEECKEAYDLSQHQRYLERGIRKWKRKEEMYKINGDEVVYAKSHDKRLEWQKRIQDFTNENNLRRDFSREYVKENNQNNNKSDGYEDVTDKWLKNATPNSHEIVFDDYFIDEEGIKHPIKGKEKISMPTKASDEYKMLETIKETFGGEVHMIPRIETEKGYKGIVKTKTPDYRWNGKKWDLKTPTLKCKFKNTLETFLKKKGAKEQAKKIIIDYINFKDKTNDEIINVVQNTLNNRDWIEDVIIMCGEKVIKILSKRKTK